MKIQPWDELDRPVFQEKDAENNKVFPLDEGFSPQRPETETLIRPTEGYTFTGNIQEGYTVRGPNGIGYHFPPGMSRREIENSLGINTLSREEGKDPTWTVLDLAKKEDKAVFSDQTVKPGREVGGKISPLLRRHYENRLAQLDYMDRQQFVQDDFTTALYGKQDTARERAEINKKLGLDQQTGEERMHASAQASSEAEDEKENTPAENQDTEDENKEERSAQSQDDFTPAPPDEPSGFDERGAWWRLQQGLKNFFSKKHEGQSVNKAPEPKELNAFERLNLPDPKKPEKETQSMSPEEKQRRNFYKEKKWHEPKGASVEEWDKTNEVFRNTQKEGTNHSELRCNTTFGRELKKMGVDVDKGRNMNGIIDGMEASGDWATIPRNKNGKLDHDKAVELAREGYVVVAVQKGEEHGHGGILTGGPNVSSGNWERKMPEIYASKGGDSAKKGGMNWQWTPEDEGSIEYKVYREKRAPMDSSGGKKKK